MVRIIHNIDGIGLVDEIREDLGEVYLDDLVVREALNSQNSPTKFLQLWAIHQIGHIGSTIQKRLPLSSIPDGFFYVFTPNDGFKYQKKSNEVFSTNMKPQQIGQSFDYALEDIKKTVEGKSVKILFFDDVSKRKLEAEITKIGLRFEHITPLHVQGYGVINLYTYGAR